MSEETKIQWCDSTVNPIMGCAGCELFPSPGMVLDPLDRAIAEAATGWKKEDLGDLFEELKRLLEKQRYSCAFPIGLEGGHKSFGNLDCGRIRLRHESAFLSR